MIKSENQSSLLSAVAVETLNRWTLIFVLHISIASVLFIFSSLPLAHALTCPEKFQIQSESALRRAIESGFTAPTTELKRGFARLDYHAADIVRLLQGDRTAELRSHMYQRKLNERLKAGDPICLAIDRADQLTADFILGEINRLGPREFIFQEMNNSLITKSLEEKTSASLFTAPETKEGLGISDALGYAMTALQKITDVYAKNMERVRVFVLEVDQSLVPSVESPFLKHPSGPAAEALILSHLPGRGLIGVYVGYPRREGNAGENSFVSIDWFYIERTSGGSSQKIQVRAAHSVRDGDRSRLEQGAVLFTVETPFRALSISAVENGARVSGFATLLRDLGELQDEQIH